MFFGLFSKPPEPPKITVFIHGTDLIPKTIIKPLERFVRHAPGMFSFDKVTLSYKYAKYLKNLCNYNPTLFPKEHAHIFCWSGKLSHRARVSAANTLHKELNVLALSYKKDYKKIDLTLVTHSHGGNVVLNLAQVKEKREYTINTLIFMAIPVQEKTRYFVKDICFKDTQIYSTYSTGDMIQVLDPQGFRPQGRGYRKLFTNAGMIEEKMKTRSACSAHDDIGKKKTPLFSQRIFCDNHVHHIKIQSGKRNIAHIEFLLPPFTKQLSSLLEAAKKHDFSKEILTFKY